jgi:hypothetical protein
MKIKEILTINLSEDIKNVIDLEDLSEMAILSEIDNYIVTDGLAHQIFLKQVYGFQVSMVQANRILENC